MGDTTKERLGDYDLVELIGDGAQGKVFKARPVGGIGGSGAEFYAVKVLRFSGDDEKKIGRFKQSAETLQKLGHPAIVRYFGNYTWHAGEWDEAHCLVMEYLDGDSLQDLIKKSPRGIPWAEAMKIFETCLEGLIYAKQQGIIHRDIKPSNIFILRTGEVKLIDFDIARREDGSQNSTAGWKGTFDYMAPDFVIVPGFRGDEQSDVFSLGVCLFQAMTGSLPFEALGEGAHIGYLNRWRDPAAVKPTVEAGIFRVLTNARQVVMNSLHPVRENRYKTFNEMLDALRTVQYRTLEHKGRATYELTDWLGRGGFGEVYRGRRQGDNLDVAIKRLFAAEYSDRFIKEARILQKYPHPALVHYVDFVEVAVMGGERQYFIVLEFLEGMPQHALRNRIKDGTRLPVREAVGLCIQYLSALQFLHENPKPIIHRDIKPSNLYAPPGHPERAKIFDMGVARDVAGTATSGGIPGTLDYMAPEFSKAGSERGSPQSDMFSLGLCFFEALTGRGVFEKLPSEMSTAWVKFQERSRPPLVLDFNHEVFQRFPPLVNVLEKALDHEPKQRYASAAQMKRELEEILPLLPEEVIAPAAPDDAAGEAVPVVADESHTMQTMASSSSVGPAPGASVVIDWSAKRKKDVWRNRILVTLGVVLVVAAAAAGVKVLPPLIKEWQEKRAAAAPPPVAGTTEAPGYMAVDEAFRIPVASSAYVADLEAELARIKSGLDQGTLHGVKPRQALTELAKQAVGMPAMFASAFDAALAAKDQARARTLLEEWKSMQSAAELMGLTVAEHESRANDMATAVSRFELDNALAGVRAAVPTDPLADGSWAQAEAAAAQLAEIETGAWDGVSDDDRKACVAKVASTLRPFVDAGLVGVDTLEDLAALEKQSPRLLVLFPDSWAKRRDALTELAQGREAFQKEIDAMLATVPADLSSSVDLARAEEIALKLKAIPDRTWPGVTDAEKQAQVSRVREALLPMMGATVASMRSAAILKSRAGQTVQSIKGPLQELEKRYPNATALVSAQQKKALQDLETAWKTRPPPESAPPPSSPSIPTTPAVAPVAETPPVVEPADANEAAFIRTMLGGGTSFTPEGDTTLDAKHLNNLLVAIAPARRGFNALDLLISPKSGQDYLAAVDEAWRQALTFTGSFGEQVQNATWQIIHAQLAKSAESTLKGQIAARPRAQQGKVRREFMKLLVWIDDITGRVSKCTEQDILRARVSLYFEESFFNDALMDVKVGGDDALESKIPWLKDKFDKVRVKRAIKAMDT
ncbi:MAG: serine/threonine-protein kinase [bacterium]